MFCVQYRLLSFYSRLRNNQSMELRQLQYFIAVAEELHFGRAAEKLRISQPPLTSHIKRLERELGVQLFHRSTRKVAMTAAGTVFRDRIRLVLRDLDEAAVEAAETRDGRRGKVRVGFVSSANYAMLPIAVRQFRSLNPQVNVDLRPLTSAEQVERLLDGELDIGLLRDPDPSISLQYTNLLVEDLVAVLPDNHELAARSSVAPNELIDTPMILFPYTAMPGFVSTVLRVFQNERRMPQVAQQAIHQETIMGLVAAGVGFAVLSASVEAMRNSGVAVVRIETAPKTKLALAEPTANRPPVVQDFVQCLMYGLPRSPAAPEQGS